ncbi:MAG: hypothetical protein WC766_03285 [Patescibacteria group bacterium]|jgi:hypothetical protein
MANLAVPAKAGLGTAGRELDNSQPWKGMAMYNKLLCNLVGFVVVYLMLTGLTGCPSPSSDTENLPSQGGSAGKAGSVGSSGTGGSAGTSTGGSGGVAEAGLGGKAGSYGTGGSAGSSTGGSGGTADAGLGGSAGSSGGTGGSAGTSTGGSAGQVVGDAGGDGPDDVVQGGSAGQAGSDAGADVSYDAVSDASGDGGPVIVCPTCDELLTWDTTQSKHSTYGKISTSSNWNDSYAWQMLKACPDWGIVGGHEGGIGDTLQIGACSDGVVLIWAYNLFSSIRLSQGWTGVTDTGLGIGASYQDFIQTYPGYTSSSMLIDASGYAMLVYANGIAVFESSKLSKLTVN